MNANDRCDRCGAQAYVRVLLSGGDLLFCGHHFSQAEVPLMALDAEIVEDTRAELVGA